MKRLIFAILLLSMPVFAQSKPFFQAIAGKWEGTLEYLDYSDGKSRVSLKAIITFKPSEDGLSAEVSTIFDDFGKIIKDQGAEKIDLAAKKYFAGESEYIIESIGEGKVVLLGSGQDGEKTEPIRKTITYTNDTLTILKETRSPWQFRNVYTLKRATENGLPANIISPAQLKEDFAALKKTLTAIHPGIYRYNSPQSLEKDFSDLEAKLDKPLSEGDFFILISQFLNKLKCGHTYTNPYNQSDKLKNGIFRRQNYLPFYFRLIGGKMIITANASSRELSIGSEIRKINGIAVKEIIEKLLTVTKADGNSTLQHRLSSLELIRNEAETYALFDLYFPLFFPFEDGVFTIEAADFASKKTTTFQVLAMTKPGRTAEMAKRYGPSPSYDDGWKFEIRDNSIGYLKIDNSITWRLKKIKFEEFLASAFAELRAKNIKSLIIDLRGNGGGSMDPGFQLSKYLAKKKLAPYAQGLRLVRNISAQPDLLKNIDTYSDELKESLKSGLPASSYRRFNDQYYEIIGRKGYPEVLPYDNNFKGRAYIIADSGNASATFQFLDYAKTNKLAAIIGQTTGGSRQGINGGNYFFLYLPNSRIEIDIPVYFQAPLKPQKDEAIIPDIQIKKLPEDIGNAFDRELAAAIEKIMRR